MESTDYAIYDVGTEGEFGFTVGKEISVQLELIRGCAEIFGYELVQNKVYNFPPNTSVSLFSWKGCQVKLWGVPVNVYLSAEKLIMIHVSMHARLEEMRSLAHSRNKKGPICLVVGPEQSGKTSFCKLLLNYAARMGSHPLYVDISDTHNTLSLPGVFSVLPFENPLYITDGLNPQNLSMFNFGFPNMKHNIPQYYLLIKTLAKVVKEHLESENTRIRNSGAIVDTCSWTKSKGYVSLTLAASAFEVDIVFVMEDEGLFSQFKGRMPSSVEVVYVPKKEGVIKSKHFAHRDFRANRIREYFYGTNEIRLNPYQFDVKFKDVAIYRSCRPKKSALLRTNHLTVGIDNIKAKKMKLNKKLENRVFAITSADVFDKNLMLTNVKGFVFVLKVNKPRRVLTVLSAQPAPLPNKVLILCLGRFMKL